MRSVSHAAILLALSTSAGIAAPSESDIRDLFAQAGQEVSWADSATDEDMRAVAELSIAGNGVVLVASSASFFEGANGAPLRAELTGATLRAAADTETTGRLTARQLAADDASALSALVHRAAGAERCEGDDAAAHLEIDARDVTFSAARSLLPAQAPGPERIEVDTLRATLRFGDGDGACAGFDAVQAQGVTSRAIDRSSAALDRLELSRSAGSETDFRLAAEGFSAQSAEGEALMAVDRLSGQLTLDAEATADLGQFELLASAQPLRDMFLSGDIPGAGIALELAGLDLPVGALLPPSMRLRAGLAQDDRITGDVGLQIDTGDDTISLDHRLDMTGLAQFGARVELRTAASGRDGGGSEMTRMLDGDAAQLEFLTGLRLVAAELSFEDDGLDAIVAALAGRSIPEILAERRDAIAANIPGPLRGGVSGPLDGIIDWTSEIVARGGGMRMAPERPVGLFDIAMTSMTAPDELGAVLGLELE